MPETLSELLAAYAPWKAKTKICSRAEWQEIRPFVEKVLASLSLGPTRGTRRYLTALTALLAFVYREGHELDVELALSAPMIEQWVASLPGSQATYRSTLRKIARELGIEPSPGSSVAYPARANAEPYSAAEIDALVAFANALSNQNRQISLRALLALGLGAGLARAGLRGVTAQSVHRHDAAEGELDGQRLFVATQGRCAPVLPRYKGELVELCELRSSGPLIGAASRDLTKNHVEWVGQRAGVPVLNPDRLRATWIVEHLNAGTGVVELVAIAGLSSCDSLSGYLAFVEPPIVSACELAISTEHEATK